MSFEQYCPDGTFDAGFGEEAQPSYSAAAFELSDSAALQADSCDAFASSPFFGDYYCENADDVTRSVAVDPGMDLDFGHLFKCSPPDEFLPSKAAAAPSFPELTAAVPSAACFTDSLPLPQRSAAALAATTLELRPGASAAALLNELRAELALDAHSAILKERPHKFRLKAEVLVAASPTVGGSGRLGGVGPMLGCTVSVRAFHVKDTLHQSTMVEFRRCAGDGVAFGYFFQNAIGRLRQAHPEAAVWPNLPSLPVFGDIGVDEQPPVAAADAGIDVDCAVAPEEEEIYSVQQPLVDMLSRGSRTLLEEALTSLVFLCGGRSGLEQKSPTAAAVATRALDAIGVLAAAADLLAASPMQTMLDPTTSSLAAKVLSHSLKDFATDGKKMKCASDGALASEALQFLGRFAAAA